MFNTLYNYYLSKGFPWWTATYDLNLFGIRFSGDPDLWNDTLGIAYKDENGNQVIELSLGTTTPGVYYLQKPMNSGGTMIMAPGYQSKIWSPGKHRGYDALVQTGSIKFWRDNDKDKIIDQGPLQSGTDMGCNHHHGFGASKIGPNSAGCIVEKHPETLTRLLELVKLQESHGHGSKVSFCLIDAEIDKEFLSFKLDDKCYYKKLKFEK